MIHYIFAFLNTSLFLKKFNAPVQLMMLLCETKLILGLRARPHGFFQNVK